MVRGSIHGDSLVISAEVFGAGTESGTKKRNDFAHVTVSKIAVPLSVPPIFF